MVRFGKGNDKSTGVGQMILDREGLGAERLVSGSGPSADPFLPEAL